MDTARDMLKTAAMLAAIMFAIVGVFYSAMDRPIGERVVVSLDDRRPLR